MHGNDTILDEKSIEKALILGRKVVEQEAHALLNLSHSLGEEFKNALKLIYACEGRLVVTGMGKSGHIGKKIAATMSSIGTPSFFLHPAEASHGDLGALTKHDVLLALSNSGESQELVDIIRFATRHTIKIISITKNPKSLLGSQSDICLLLPNEVEACPIGCAPTSSTTMSLALGDALSMALLDLRGFNAHDFHDFHPGGKLGNSLVRVSNIMHSGEKLPVMNPTASMAEAVVEMTSKGFGCIAIVDMNAKSRELLGIIADGDLRRHMSTKLLEKNVLEIMTKNPTTIHADALASKAVGLMNEKGITSLMVVDDNNNLEGLVHMHDCLRVGIH